MKTRTVNIHEAKTNLSRLLARVSKGEEIVIAKAGKPLARLVPIEKPRTMTDAFDLYKGQVWVAPDFDAPLPEDVLADFEGRDEGPA
jgi:prevent-host-death family protein